MDGKMIFIIVLIDIKYHYFTNQVGTAIFVQFSADEHNLVPVGMQLAVDLGTECLFSNQTNAHF
jgi:hypothetical protein